ncbi:phage tail assembly chaperone G [Listeria monocytogenes]|uniref:phage tail assembly chaperone G n=1 Tax=Listeria monocytogenes TaxID=1639 RepID=UPI003F9C3FE4|nr:hypothetical protein [Listeria monocytogenes]EIL5159775.1 hypothetical protein [Listeria monocytogenes]
MAKKNGTKITLITAYNEEKEEFTTKTYSVGFIKGRVLMEALKIQSEMEANELTDALFFEKLVDFVTDTVFQGQFTTDQLLDGIRSSELMDTLQRIFLETMGIDKSQVKDEKIKSGK